MDLIAELEHLLGRAKGIAGEAPGLVEQLVTRVTATEQQLAGLLSWAETTARVVNDLAAQVAGAAPPAAPAAPAAPVAPAVEEPAAVVGAAAAPGTVPPVVAAVPPLVAVPGPAAVSAAPAPVPEPAPGSGAPVAHPAALAEAAEEPAARTQ